MFNLRKKISRKRLIETKKYSMTKDEYFYYLMDKEKRRNMVINKLLNKEEAKIDVERILFDVENYEDEKKVYFSLTRDEQLKLEVVLFAEELKLQTEESRKLQILFETESLKNKEYYYILRKLQEKKQLYISILSNYIKDKYFDPPITPLQINYFANQMVKDEYIRLSQNLNNYNFFVSNLLNYYSDDDILCIPDNNIGVKTSILMFLLVTDYEKNKINYNSYDLPDLKINYIASKNNHGVDDDFTTKAKNREIATIIRNSASHGEYYVYNDNIIFKNSRGIPRIDFTLSYNELYEFVMSNLTEDTKIKYKFLIKLLNIRDYNIGKCSKENLKELMVFMLNNTIQYNYNHHFKTIEVSPKIFSKTDTNTFSDVINMSKELDFSMFSYYDMTNDGVDVTTTLGNEEKLSIIKNGLGHDKAYWNFDEIIVDNIYIPSRGKMKHKKCVTSFEKMIEFFINQNLYDTLLISKYDYYYLNSIRNNYSNLKL